MKATDHKAESTQTGPVRTMQVGDVITVCGDLEILDVHGQRVQVRVRPASSPILFPVKTQLKAPAK